MSLTDSLTPTQRDTILKGVEAIDKLRAALNPTQDGIVLHNLSFPDAMKAIKSHGLKLFDTVKFPLDGATTDEMHSYAGRFFYVLSIQNSAGADVAGTINVKFNRNDSRSIPLVAGQGVVTPFDRFYLTNTANAGAIATIIFAEDFDLFKIIDNRLATAISTITSLGSITGSVAGLTGAYPAGATIVSARALVAGGGANPTALYTVTAAKTLFVANSWVGASEAGGVTAAFELRHTTSGGVLIKVINAVAAEVGQGPTSFLNHLPQIQLAAGEKLELNSRTWADASNTTGNRGAWFWGWEI